MKKIKIQGPQDVFDIIKRRKWLMLVPFLLCTMAVTLVVYGKKKNLDGIWEYLLPNIYQSETMIIVEDQKIPTNILPNLDGVGTMQRLNMLRQQILSRSNLAAVVKDFNLYNDFRIPLKDDDKISALHRSIHVEVNLAQLESSSRVAYFKLAHENKDSYMAQRVTSRLAQLFIEYDYRRRLKTILDTIEFFTNEVNLLEAQLREYEDRERRFREAHLDELPEVADRNSQMLQAYQSKARGATEALDRAEMRLQTLRRELAGTSEFLENKKTQVTGGEKVGSDDTGEKPEDSLAAARRALALAQERYTEKHPDYQAAVRRVQQLERQRSVSEGKGLPTSERRTDREVKSNITLTANPEYQNLKREIEKVEAEVMLRRNERDTAQAEAATLEFRLKNTPQVQVKLSDITRDLGPMRERYLKLRNTLNDAKMTGSIEARQKGETFKIQDPATLPNVPVKPKRAIYVLFGAAIGLALGILLAVLRELFDEKIRTRAEIEGPLGVPVLVEIPEILNPREIRLKQMKKVLAFTFSIVLFVGVIAIFVQLFFRNYQVIIEYVILSGLV